MQIARKTATSLAVAFIRRELDIKGRNSIGFDQGTEIVGPLFDKEMRKILSRLKAFGYVVDKVDHPEVNAANADVQFYYAFRVPGFGHFSGHSLRSR